VHNGSRGVSSIRPSTRSLCLPTALDLEDEECVCVCVSDVLGWKSILSTSGMMEVSSPIRATHTHTHTHTHCCGVRHLRKCSFCGSGTSSERISLLVCVLITGHFVLINADLFECINLNMLRLAQQPICNPYFFFQTDYDIHLF